MAQSVYFIVFCTCLLSVCSVFTSYKRWLFQALGWSFCTCSYSHSCPGTIQLWSFLKGRETECKDFCIRILQWEQDDKHIKWGTFQCSNLWSFVWDRNNETSHMECLIKRESRFQHVLHVDGSSNQGNIFRASVSSCGQKRWVKQNINELGVTDIR